MLQLINAFSRRILVLAMLASLEGCSALNMVKVGFRTDPARDNIDGPQRLHSQVASSEALAKTKLDDLKAYGDSAATPLVNYFAAMRNAYPTVTDSCDRQKVECAKAALPANLENYMSAGIGLVNDYCDQWFEVLERSEKRLNYEVQNDNIIKQLGTTLLGIGGASRVIVAGYGAFNTATAGFEDSFKGAFLFAPSANRAHVLVKAALVAKAEQLQQKFVSSNAHKPVFIEVYNDLVSYGEVCTDATARRLITDSVSAATATVSRDGSVVVQPNISQEAIVAALTLKLAQIKVDQAQSNLLATVRDLDALKSRKATAVAEVDRLNQLLRQKSIDISSLDKAISDQATIASAAQKSFNDKKVTYDIIADGDSSKADAKLQVQAAEAGATAVQKSLQDLIRSKELAQQALADLNSQLATQRTIGGDTDKAIDEKTKAITAAQVAVSAAKAELPTR